jgi:hypothetical protein
MGGGGIFFILRIEQEYNLSDFLFLNLINNIVINERYRPVEK